MIRLKRLFGAIVPLLCSLTSMAEDSQAVCEIYSLDSLRSMALRNNKELRMSELKKDAAYWNRKAAFTKYLPHVDFAASYMYTSREVSLLDNEQKDLLKNAGSAVGQTMLGFQQQMGQMIASVPDPQMQAILANMVGQLAGSAQNLPSAINAASQSILDAFHTDTRNMGVFAAMFTQPLYMGGKIVAYNKITKYAEELEDSRYEQEAQNVIVSVDQTYWSIIQLYSKKKLAQSYIDLIKKLDSDVEQLITQGFATKADGLSVKVKLNEAEVTMIQIDNGLSLLKMLLAQNCGIPDYNFKLADENRDSFDYQPMLVDDVTEALSQRQEMHQLRIAADIYNEKVKIVRSEFMPTLALTGGYLATNPSVFNGFQNKFGGMWNVGVALKVPVVTWGERLYKVRSAKAEAKIQEMRVDEVSEKIELQVKQCQQKLQEAIERKAVAERSQAQADENLRVAEYGLKEGVIPLSNVLSAQTAWLSAHSTYVSSQIDMMLADLYLRKALGRVR